MTEVSLSTLQAELNAAQQRATDLNAVIERMEFLIVNLLGRVGELGKCRDCGAAVYWVLHKSNKLSPYDPSGMTHFATCDKAAVKARRIVTRQRKKPEQT